METPKTESISVILPITKHGGLEYSYVAEAILTKDGYKITDESAKAIVGMIRNRPY
jgi:hypothetical protein